MKKRAFHHKKGKGKKRVFYLVSEENIHLFQLGGRQRVTLGVPPPQLHLSLLGVGQLPPAPNDDANEIVDKIKDFLGWFLAHL